MWGLPLQLHVLYSFFNGSSTSFLSLIYLFMALPQTVLFLSLRGFISVQVLLKCTLNITEVCWAVRSWQGRLFFLQNVPSTKELQSFWCSQNITVWINHFEKRSVTDPEGGSVSLYGGGWVDPQVRGKLQYLSRLTSPLLLTKCSERFGGILICLVCISSPYLPVNPMTVIWRNG